MVLGFIRARALREILRFEIEMQIREYKPDDLDALKRIHEKQNFPYPFPDLQNPLFLTKIVLTDGEVNVAPGFTKVSSDRVLGAALLRLTAEAYLLLDPKAGTPKARWQSLLLLHEAARRNAWHRGLEDVHAWLPPAIARKFGRRITQLGWQRDDAWTPYCLRFGKQHDQI
jgi:hypothetical protein